MANNKNTGIIIATVAGALLMTCCCCPVGYGFIKRDKSTDKEISEHPTQAVAEATTEAVEPIAVYNIPVEGDSEYREEMKLNANTDTPVIHYVYSLPAGHYIADSVESGKHASFKVVKDKPAYNPKLPYPESLDTVCTYTLNNYTDSERDNRIYSKGTVEFDLHSDEKISVFGSLNDVKFMLISKS